MSNRQTVFVSQVRPHWNEIRLRNAPTVNTVDIQDDPEQLLNTLPPQTDEKPMLVVLDWVCPSVYSSHDGKLSDTVPDHCRWWTQEPSQLLVRLQEQIDSHPKINSLELVLPAYNPAQQIIKVPSTADPYRFQRDVLQNKELLACNPILESICRLDIGKSPCAGMMVLQTMHSLLAFANGGFVRLELGRTESESRLKGPSQYFARVLGRFVGVGVTMVIALLVVPNLQPTGTQIAPLGSRPSYHPIVRADHKTISVGQGSNVTRQLYDSAIPQGLQPTGTQIAPLGSRRSYHPIVQADHKTGRVLTPFFDGTGQISVGQGSNVMTWQLYDSAAQGLAGTSRTPTDENISKSFTLLIQIGQYHAALSLIGLPTYPAAGAVGTSPMIILQNITRDIAAWERTLSNDPGLLRGVWAQAALEQTAHGADGLLEASALQRMLLVHLMGSFPQHTGLQDYCIWAFDALEAIGPGLEAASSPLYREVTNVGRNGSRADTAHVLALVMNEKSKAMQLTHTATDVAPESAAPVAAGGALDEVQEVARGSGFELDLSHGLPLSRAETKTLSDGLRDAQTSAMRNTTYAHKVLLRVLSGLNLNNLDYVQVLASAVREPDAALVTLIRVGHLRWQTLDCLIRPDQPQTELPDPMSHDPVEFTRSRMPLSGQERDHAHRLWDVALQALQDPRVPPSGREISLHLIRDLRTMLGVVPSETEVAAAWPTTQINIDVDLPYDKNVWGKELKDVVSNALSGILPTPTEWLQVMLRTDIGDRWEWWLAQPVDVRRMMMKQCLEVVFKCSGSSPICAVGFDDRIFTQDTIVSVCARILKMTARDLLRFGIEQYKNALLHQTRQPLSPSSHQPFEEGTQFHWLYNIVKDLSGSFRRWICMLLRSVDPTSDSFRLLTAEEKW